MSSKKYLSFKAVFPNLFRFAAPPLHVQKKFGGTIAQQTTIYSKKGDNFWHFSILRITLILLPLSISNSGIVKISQTLIITINATA